MAFQGPKFSKKRTIQKFNLKELLGREPSEFEKEQFLADAIDYIRDRTEAGKDIEGDDFEQYSEEYAKKKGVPRSDVNMRLLGNMMRSIQGEMERKNIVKIEIADDLQAKKSYNHNTGDRGPKRTFFGLTYDDAEEIASSIKRPTIGDLLDRVGGLQGEFVDE